MNWITRSRRAGLGFVAGATVLAGSCLLGPWIGHAATPGDNGGGYTYSDRAEYMKKYLRPAGPEFPVANSYTEARELLGRTLFFDPRLSGSKFISCATCHNPGFAWGDGLPKGIGDGMKGLKRHTPTILNAAYGELMFRDGRADSLEAQALGPIKSPAEMNQPLGQAVERISSIPGYKPLFDKAYPGEPISEETIAKAIATFERTVVSGQAPFDRWIAGDEHAVSEPAKRGFDLFNHKAGCAQCHSGWNFTDSGFHDIGVNDDDLGRGALVKIEAMQHAFKTPTLRNVTLRAPYLHNGSESSLVEVIDFYDAGGKAQRASLAPEVHPLHLTSDEKADLFEFLRTLTSVEKPATIPALPR
ncbi:MAG: cytochrome c peroxidase [Bryobacteraceae bacterium]